MAATTVDRNTPERNARDFAIPVEAATKIPAGVIACINAAGNLVNGAATAAFKTVGRTREYADNTGGAAGAIKGNVERGCFRFANSAAADQLTLADYGATCYVVDNQTVAKTNAGATRPAAGVVRDVDAGGVWVEF